MGMKEMLHNHDKHVLAEEADNRWNQYKELTIATILAFIVVFIPVINILYVLAIFIFGIVFLVKTMKYLSSCKDSFITS